MESSPLPLPTSLIKPTPYRLLLNVARACWKCPSYCLIAGPIRSTLVRTRRQPWSRVSLFCVSSQTRLMRRGTCLFDLDRDESLEYETFCGGVSGARCCWAGNVGYLDQLTLLSAAGLLFLFIWLDSKVIGRQPKLIVHPIANCWLSQCLYPLQAPGAFSHY